MVAAALSQIAPPKLASWCRQGFFAALINEANTGLGPVGQVRGRKCRQGSMARQKSRAGNSASRVGT